jgi:hypothetical protein
MNRLVHIVCKMPWETCTSSSTPHFSFTSPLSFLFKVHGEKDKNQSSIVFVNWTSRVRICKRLGSPEIDSASLRSLAVRYVNQIGIVAMARQAGNRFLGSFN